MDLERGKYIILESGDGCGKGGQIKLLGEFFDQNNLPYVFVREPGGTPEGEAAREIAAYKIALFLA